MSKDLSPDRLVVLRDNEATLRRLLVDAEPQHAPAIARELRATVREIAELESQVPQGVSVADQLEAKRRAKLAAADPAPAVRGGKSRRSGGSNRTG
jgi:hypothetical protein